MTTAAGRPVRPARRPADKLAVRRDQLAESALVTLGERGYANTSLRDIAQNSAFSHGVVHYYFKDKTELIVHGLRLYKQRRVAHYDVLIAAAPTAPELAERWSANVAKTIARDARFHAVWYDLRIQSAFERDYREPMQEIDRSLEDMVTRVCERYAELSGGELVLPGTTVYAVLDGIFEQTVLATLDGDSDAPARLAQRFCQLLPLFVT